MPALLARVLLPYLGYLVVAVVGVLGYVGWQSYQRHVGAEQARVQQERVNDATVTKANKASKAVVRRCATASARCLPDKYYRD
jgi:predicted negative regulator of RcsB-dependent stress response